MHYSGASRCSVESPVHLWSLHHSCLLEFPGAFLSLQLPSLVSSCPLESPLALIWSLQLTSGVSATLWSLHCRQQPRVGPVSSFSVHQLTYVELPPSAAPVVSSAVECPFCLLRVFNVLESSWRPPYAAGVSVTSSMSRPSAVPDVLEHSSITM